MADNDITRFKYAHDAFVKRGHTADLLLNNDRFTIIDWKKADLSTEYYVNYIIDKKRGVLIISGDLGDAVANWYNENTPEDIASYTRSIGYFISKMQTATNSYYYDEDNVIADIKEEVGVYDDSNTAEQIDELCDDIYDNTDRRSGYHPSDDAREILSDLLGDDYYENLSDYGKRTDIRVYLWSEGLNMALDDLKSHNLMAETA